MPVDAALVLARWLFLAASTACFGLALFPFYALRGEGAPGVRSHRLQAAAAAVALLAAIAWLGLAVVAFGGRDLASFLGTLGTVLFATSLGPAWLLRLAAALALLLVAALRPRPLPLLALAAVVLGTEAGIGHGATHGWTYQLAQVVHLLAAGAWLGGLLALATLLHGAPGALAEDHVAAVLLRFSTVGIVSVIAIAATGALSAWLMLERAANPFGAYGRLVMVQGRPLLRRCCWRPPTTASGWCRASRAAPIPPSRCGGCGSRSSRSRASACRSCWSRAGSASPIPRRRLPGRVCQDFIGLPPAPGRGRPRGGSAGVQRQ